jgi:hypothetical protein
MTEIVSSSALEAKPVHHNQPPAQWRTVISSISMAGMLNLTYFFSRAQGEIASKMFSDLCWASTFMAAVVGGKAVFQHVSANGGIKNVIGGLMGAKP